jgi:peroxiredoxin
MIHDSGCGIAKAFGVAGRLGGINQATFLIDEDGTIRKVYGRVKAKGHAAAILQECQAVWSASGPSNADVRE